MFPKQLLHRWIPLCRIMKNTPVHILDKELLQSRICGWEQPLVLDCLIQPLLNKIPENCSNILPSRRIESYIRQLRQSPDCSSSTWMRWSWGRGIAQMDCGSSSGLDGDCMNPSMRWFLGGRRCRRRLRSGSFLNWNPLRAFILWRGLLRRIWDNRWTCWSKSHQTRPFRGSWRRNWERSAEIKKLRLEKNEKMKTKIYNWLTKVSPTTWSPSNFSADFSADLTELREEMMFPEGSEKSNKGTESWKLALGVSGSCAREKSRGWKRGGEGAALRRSSPEELTLAKLKSSSGKSWGGGGTWGWRISPEELTSAKVKSSSGKSGCEGAAELRRRFPEESTSAKPKSSSGNNSSAECWARFSSEKSRE